MFSNTLGISEKTIHNGITGATRGIPKSKTGSGNSKGNNCLFVCLFLFNDAPTLMGHKRLTRYCYNKKRFLLRY